MVDYELIPRRKEGLHGINRYSCAKVMYYRRSVYEHTQRVYHLLEDVLDEIRNAHDSKFSEDYARMLALVHDDAERITGDHQLSDKIRMSDAELCRLKEEEASAIEELVKESPIVGGYLYHYLLHAALHKDILEVQIVSYIDKMDAYGECVHEIMAGNEEFVPLIKNTEDSITQLRDLYSEAMFPSSHPLLQEIPDIDHLSIAKSGKLHTPESITIDSGIPAYERWKEVTIQHFGKEFLISLSS